MNEEKAFARLNNQLEDGLNMLEDQIKRAEGLAGRLGSLMPHEGDRAELLKTPVKPTEFTHLEKLESSISRFGRLTHEMEYVLNNFNNMI